MSVNTPTLYRGITDKVTDVVAEFMDAQDWLYLFPRDSSVDELTDKVIFSYLNPIVEASLSRELYDPNIVQLAAEQIAKQVFYSSIELNLKYKDWNKWQKMPGAMFNKAMAEIAAKPSVQMTQYFMTGEEFTIKRTYRAPPNPQYNFLRDQGSGSGTLSRPIPKVTTGIAWDSQADIEAQVNDGVGDLVEAGFTNLNQTLFLYPRVAYKTMSKGFTSSGDGKKNAFMILEEHGIPRSNMIMLENQFLPTGAAGSLTTPTALDWDGILVDRSSLLIFDTLKKYANSYIDNSGHRFPGMTLEAGMGTLPIFFPYYNVEDAKYYKGVSIIDGIGTD